MFFSSYLVDDVAYSKLYPYSRSVEVFVASEVSDVSKNGIIWKSKSPYNNSVWGVDKKGTDVLGSRNKR